MIMECHEYTVRGRYDTAGRPVYGWKCYCGTTACLKQKKIQYFAEIEQIDIKRYDELSPEEEKKFYDKAFDRAPLPPKE